MADASFMGWAATRKNICATRNTGINAIFNEPLERPAALKLVRATRMLVLHEFRRYVRIPVMTEVSVVGRWPAPQCVQHRNEYRWHVPQEC